MIGRHETVEHHTDIQVLHKTKFDFLRILDSLMSKTIRSEISKLVNATFYHSHNIIKKSKFAK
jgi:hypothetical protein